MIGVVTFVGSLIHIYSIEFMMDDEGYSRFFSYMNLFVGSMLVLVLAGNLLLLYLGWEAVGLCSYLLIGFWYKAPANSRAAIKAFVTTRVGDTALAVALFLIFRNLGTLEIDRVMRLAEMNWPEGSTLAVAVALLILAGSIGKSAQLPLQVWLPDAMAGPTPVSALIHAATMVTAGVYLIARTHVFFVLAPIAGSVVSAVGAATLIVAGCSALAQRDIKRVLAYSTISQIGYMFLALGIGAWTAAIFHLVTHAFFKSLLFLCAGAVISATGGEHDMFRMGGLRRKLPVTFAAFLIGAASLSAVPLLTAGFFSKDMILSQAWSSGPRGPLLWTIAETGSLITALYTFRMVFLTFYGEARTEVSRRPGLAETFPLVALALFATASGFIEMPSMLSPVRLFSSFLETALPAYHAARGTGRNEGSLLLISGAIPLIGIAAAYLLFLVRRQHLDRLVGTTPGRLGREFFLSGWGFDRLYALLILRPFAWFSRVNRDDFVDLIYAGIAWYSAGIHRALARTQTGMLRWYAAVILLGVIALLAGVVLTR
jgi:NADH-quinone oxidoreductase subunit L